MGARPSPGRKSPWISSRDRRPDRAVHASADLHLVHCRRCDRPRALVAGAAERRGLGLAAGIFNSIPYFGPFIVTAGLAVVAFLQFGTFGMTGCRRRCAPDHVTRGLGADACPLGKTGQMNRVAVFAGLLFWSWMWGIWGTLLAVMMMVVKASATTSRIFSRSRISCRSDKEPLCKRGQRRPWRAVTVRRCDVDRRSDRPRGPGRQL